MYLFSSAEVMACNSGWPAHSLSYPSLPQRQWRMQDPVEVQQWVTFKRSAFQQIILMFQEEKKNTILYYINTNTKKGLLLFNTVVDL